MTDRDEDLLTVGDFARIVGRSPSAIHAAVIAGRVAVAKRTSGGMKLFARAEAERFRSLPSSRPPFGGKPVCRACGGTGTES